MSEEIVIARFTRTFFKRDATLVPIQEPPLVGTICRKKQFMIICTNCELTELLTAQF